jgi:hypothetical protein
MTRISLLSGLDLPTPGSGYRDRETFSPGSPTRTGVLHRAGAKEALALTARWSGTQEKLSAGRLRALC